MKILKINSSKNTLSNSNTKKHYKAISLASLSTLALTLTLPTDIVNAVVGKPGVNPPIKFYGSSGSRVITAPHSRPPMRPSTNPIPSTSGNTFRPSSNPNTSGNKFKPNTNIATNSAGNTFKPNSKPSDSSKPTTSIGTQTNLGTNNKLQGSKSPSGSKIPVQFPINDSDFDNISLGSTSSTSSKGSLSVNAGSLSDSDGNTTTNKKGLSNKNKVALGAVGATIALGTTIGLAAGLAPKGDSNSGNKDTTAPPNSVPTPNAPSYSTIGFVNNPDGFLFIDEKA